MEDRAYIDFVHTGPGTLASRYLRTFWQPVARVQDLPRGRTLPIEIMSEQLTLYRGRAACRTSWPFAARTAAHSSLRAG